MSSLWTPSGERPIRREPELGPPASAPPQPGPRPSGGGREPTDEEIRAELEEFSHQILQVPVAAVIANHCIGLFQLAAIHLDQQPPNLEEARLAIDALGAVVEGLGPRLAGEEMPLRDALTQIRIGFVTVRDAASGPLA